MKRLLMVLLLLLTSQARSEIKWPQANVSDAVINGGVEQLGHEDQADAQGDEGPAPQVGVEPDAKAQGQGREHEVGLEAVVRGEGDLQAPKGVEELVEDAAKEVHGLSIGHPTPF